MKTGGGTITGVVSGDDNAPVPFAVVLLKNKSDSLLFKGEQSDEQGRFTFNPVPDGNYFLTIQSPGLTTYIKDSLVISADHSQYDLGTLRMSSSVNELSGVQIVADRPFIERLVDRTVVNIENSIIQTGSSVMDIMEKLPAVMVTQDGVITLKGKSGVMIFMDGKPTGLSPQDLANLLRGLPSSNIQKIEIITNPPARYDASGNAGIINIITKKNRRDGINGNITAGYGQGRYEKYNTAFMLALKRKKYNLQFSYAYSHRKGFNNLKLVRYFHAADTLNAVFDTDDYILFPFNTQTPRVAYDYNFNDKTSISIIGSSVINLFNPTASNHTDLLDGNENKVSSYEFTSLSQDKWYNYALNTQLKHVFDTTGKELTVDLDYARYWNNTDQRFSTVYLDHEGGYLSENILLGDQDGELSIYSAKADYSQPAGKKSRFETGWKSSYVATDNNSQFFNEINGSAVFDSARSNHFIYSENINAAYVNWSRQGETFSWQLGLRSEHTLAHGNQVLTGTTFKRNYIKVFPSIFLDYKLNKKNSLNFTAGTRIDRPMYQQMNPFRRLIDATTYAEGNPFLLPQISYNTELTFVYNQSLFVTLGYSYTHNNITDVLIQDSEKKITIQALVNLEAFNYFNVNITYSAKITKWWTTNTNLLWYYGIYTGSINNYSINQGIPSFFINSNQSFTINDRFSAEAGYLYNYKNLYGVTLMRTTSSLTGGIRMMILKKKGSIVLNANDVLWKSYPRGDTHFGNVDEYWIAKRDTRQVYLTFQYRFGKGGMSRSRRTTGADDEKKRTGNM